MTVFITGASRGIGRGLVEEFARLGHSVGFCWLNSDKKASELIDGLKKQGCCVEGFKADVSNKAEICRAIAEAEKKLGGIDLLINNAGIAQSKLFTDIDEADWDRMFDINVKGVYNATQAVLPSMLKRKSGRIINISSMWGIAGAATEVHYSASKAAVIGFTKALAKELGPSGIAVNCIAPGVIDTDMNALLTESDINDIIESTPLGKIGTPKDISKLALFLSSDSFITGQIITADGGFTL